MNEMQMFPVTFESTQEAVLFPTVQILDITFNEELKTSRDTIRKRDVRWGQVPFVHLY